MDETLKEAYSMEAARIAALSSERLTGDYSSPVFGEGPLGARLMFIGEAPGREEAAAGKPFVGKAGKQLDSMLSLAGIAREEAFVTNSVKFRPTKAGLRSVSNRTPAPGEVKASLPLLRLELKRVSPRFIATLGNTPLRALFALAGEKPPSIGAVHGQKYDIIIDGQGFALFPLYHPASGIYDRSLIKEMETDLMRLATLLKEDI